MWAAWWGGLFKYTTPIEPGNVLIDWGIKHLLWILPLSPLLENSKSCRKQKNVELLDMRIQKFREGHM